MKRFRIPIAIALLSVLLAGVLPSLRINVSRQSTIIGFNDDAIWQLIDEGKVIDIQIAVKLSGKRIDDFSWLGGSLLYWAAKHKRIDVAEWLLAQGASPNGTRPAMTPLRPAIWNQGIAMVKLLIAAGADVDAGSGLTPREIAEVRGNAEIIDAFAAPANVNGEFRYGDQHKADANYSIAL